MFEKKGKGRNPFHNLKNKKALRFLFGLESFVSKKKKIQSEATRAMFSGSSKTLTCLSKSASTSPDRPLLVILPVMNRMMAGRCGRRRVLPADVTQESGLRDNQLPLVGGGSWFPSLPMAEVTWRMLDRTTLFTSCSRRCWCGGVGLASARLSVAVWLLLAVVVSVISLSTSDW